MATRRMRPVRLIVTYHWREHSHTAFVLEGQPWPWREFHRAFRKWSHEPISAEVRR